MKTREANRKGHTIAKAIIFVVVLVTVISSSSLVATIVSITVWFYGEDLIFPAIAKALKGVK